MLNSSKIGCLRIYEYFISHYFAQLSSNSHGATKRCSTGAVHECWSALPKSWQHQQQQQHKHTYMLQGTLQPATTRTHDIVRPTRHVLYITTVHYLKKEGQLSFIFSFSSLLLVIFSLFLPATFFSCILNLYPRNGHCWYYFVLLLLFRYCNVRAKTVTSKCDHYMLPFGWVVEKTLLALLALHLDMGTNPSVPYKMLLILVIIIHSCRKTRPVPHPVLKQNTKILFLFSCPLHESTPSISTSRFSNSGWNFEKLLLF